MTAGKLKPSRMEEKQETKPEAQNERWHATVTAGSSVTCSSGAAPHGPERRNRAEERAAWAHAAPVLLRRGMQSLCREVNRLCFASTRGGGNVYL